MLVIGEAPEPGSSLSDPLPSALGVSVFLEYGTDLHVTQYIISKDRANTRSENGHSR